MDALSIICIVGGCLTIITRGPLVFAPITTLRTYDRWFLSTNARMRVFGVVLVALATELLLLARACCLTFSTPWDGSQQLKRS